MKLYEIISIIGLSCFAIIFILAILAIWNIVPSYILWKLFWTDLIVLFLCLITDD